MHFFKKDLFYKKRCICIHVSYIFNVRATRLCANYTRCPFFKTVYFQLSEKSNNILILLAQGIYNLLLTNCHDNYRNLRYLHRGSLCGRFPAKPHISMLRKKSGSSALNYQHPGKSQRWSEGKGRHSHVPFSLYF